MVCQPHWTILTPSSTHQINLHPVPVTQKGDSCYCWFRIIPESRSSIAQVHAPGTSRRKLSWCSLQLLVSPEGLAVRCNWHLARAQRGQGIRTRRWGVIAVDDANPQSPRERFGHALSFISDNLINQ